MVMAPVEGGLLLLTSIYDSFRVFENECVRWMVSCRLWRSHRRHRAPDI